MQALNVEDNIEGLRYGKVIPPPTRTWTACTSAT